MDKNTKIKIEGIIRASQERFLMGIQIIIYLGFQYFRINSILWGIFQGTISRCVEFLKWNILYL